MAPVFSAAADATPAVPPTPIPPGVAAPASDEAAAAATVIGTDTDAAPADAEQVPEPTLLLAPRDGVPPVVDTPEALEDAIRRLAAGRGPVAVDTERASGYRYGQRAYLVQLRRQGAGTFLIDPIPIPDLSALRTALADAEWVLHAASQDLPCLTEIGMVPDQLFDTELAGRLLGYERVGLGAMLERVLGISLEKGHSAADWSTRPLPEPWLRYAALDVELLVDLRDVLHEELVDTGKLEWAREEFEAVRSAPPREPRVEPWRRTSGIHRVRQRRQLAVVRSLWYARDRIAKARDVAPGRLLPDAAIVEAATAGPSGPASREALVALGGFSGPRTRRHADAWWRAIAEAAALPEGKLPAAAAMVTDAGPPANRWAERDPAAADRLARAREALRLVAERIDMPMENLLEPAAVRRLTWSPPPAPDPDTVRAALQASGARSWQVDLTAGVLAEVLAAVAG